MTPEEKRKIKELEDREHKEFMKMLIDRLYPDSPTIRAKKKAGVI